MTNLVIKQILDLIKKNTFFNFIKNKNNSYRLIIIIDICNLTCNQKLFISKTTLPILILDD